MLKTKTPLAENILPVIPANACRDAGGTSPWMGEGRTMQEQLSRATQEQLPRAGIQALVRTPIVWFKASGKMTGIKSSGFFQAGIYLLLAVTVLTGCGFHLRGSVQLPESVSVIYMQDNTSSQIAPILKQQLTANKVKLASTAKQARAILIVHGEQYQKRVLSVGGSGKVQEFVLQYTVHFSLLEREGETLLKQQSVSLERDLRFDENAVLATSSEEAQRKRDMIQDAARQILRRIQSVNNTGSSE